MSGDGISDDLRRFIFDHIDSVEMVDVLLLLRSAADREWSAKSVSDELRTNPASAASRLKQLRALGVVQEREGGDSPAYRYEPRSRQLEELADALAEACRVRRHRVLELIFSPIKRARHFADAFVVGTRKSNEDKDG